MSKYRRLTLFKRSWNLMVSMPVIDIIQSLYFRLWYKWSADFKSFTSSSRSSLHPSRIYVQFFIKFHPSSTVLFNEFAQSAAPANCGSFILNGGFLWKSSNSWRMKWHCLLNNILTSEDFFETQSVMAGRDAISRKARSICTAVATTLTSSKALLIILMTAISRSY